MLIRLNFFRKKLRAFFYRAFCWLENNNNIDFSSNGEEHLINAITRYLSALDNVQLEIFDVGANRGDYTQILLEKLSDQRLNARINLFEPTGACFQILTNLYSVLPNVVLNQMAVSNSNGTLQIYYDREESALASLYQRNLAAYGKTLNQSETVKTIRLDDYIKASGIIHIHLLKIDIEGHEIPAFEGMGDYLSGDFVDIIQFEYGGANLDSNTSLMDLYTLLESRGFVVGKVMPRGVEIRTYQLWMDNFQYANYVAISRPLAEKLKS
jgi:FkbM family methyltransferase